MPDRYFNPFQAIDINVPVEFHEAFTRLLPTHRQRGDRPESVSSHGRSLVSVRMRCSAAWPGASRHCKIRHTQNHRRFNLQQRSVAGSHPNADRSRKDGGRSGRLRAAQDDDARKRPRGGRASKVIEMLKDGDAEPIWNLSDAIDGLLRKHQSA